MARMEQATEWSNNVRQFGELARKNGVRVTPVARRGSAGQPMGNRGTAGTAAHGPNDKECWEKRLYAAGCRLLGWRKLGFCLGQARRDVFTQLYT